MTQAPSPSVEFQRKAYFGGREIPRVVLMLMAAFSGYQIRTGRQQDGTTRFLDVPVIYGGMERTVAYLLRGGNDNAISYVPCASLYITGLKQNPQRRHNPSHVETVDWIEGDRDADGRIIANRPGRRVTMERAMPVPHIMNFEVAFWCSNEEQGFQMIEQIGSIYNPACDLLISNSPQDWSKYTSVVFSGEYKIERVIPDTSADPLYVYTFPFEIEFWMNLPAKLYDTKLIYEIHVPIGEIEKNFNFDSMEEITKVVIKASEQDRLVFEAIE